MSMLSRLRFRRILLFVLFIVSMRPASAATLAPVPAPSVQSPGDQSLSDQTVLGFPGIVWAPAIVWDHSDQVHIEVAVDSPQGDPGIPIAHNLFLTATNNTPDVWSGIELVINGSATFVPIPPTTLSLPGATPPIMTPTSVRFEGLDWPAFNEQAGLGTSATLAASIEVLPPSNNEPIVFSLRPIAVPEPATGTLLIVGTALVRRRRRE